jgi:hypothetical protein
MGAAAVRLLTRSDAEDLFWSLQAPGPPVDRVSDAEIFSRRVRPWLMIELAVIQGLFAAAVSAVLRRQWGFCSRAWRS